MKQLWTLACILAAIEMALALAGCGGRVGDLPDLDFGEPFQSGGADAPGDGGGAAGDDADVARDNADVQDDDGDSTGDAAELPDDDGGVTDEGADLPDDDGELTDLGVPLVGTWQAESAVVNGRRVAVAVVGGV